MSSHAVALNSCTAALFLAQLGLGIGPGDAVITTPLTFVATANSIRHCGATALFADVEDESGLLDPKEVERLIVEDCTIDPADDRPVHRASGAKIRAVLPVHLWGQPADIPSFRRLCDRYRLALVEDAAHAIESSTAAGKVGTTADATCFSFYATKNICTGEGGMVSTKDEALASRIRVLSNHGLSRNAWTRFSDSGFSHYVALESGYKFNMMDIQASMGIHQLKRIGAMLEERNRQWVAYRTDLRDLPISLPPAQAKYGLHSRHLFTLRISPASGMARDEFIRLLHERGVGTGVHYLAVTDHPAWTASSNRPLPNSERISRETVSLPLGGALTEDQRKRVVHAVRAVLGRT